MSKLNFNPFFNSGIASYEQFKKLPFLISSNLNLVNNRISQEIEQIENGYFFSDRLILLGMRGIGKTSTLFFIKDKLEKKGIKTIFFSRVFENIKHFNLISGLKLWDVSKEPVYILVDFPDSVNTQAYKNFLICLWEMLTHKNYDKINFIFAMNISHYDKSFMYSEILGKFTTIRLEPLNFGETSSLLKERLKIAGDENLFSKKINEKIYDYSKGIPRNIISAGNLVVNSTNGEPLSEENVNKILETKFLEQVINDRVEDINDRLVYKKMIEILRESFDKKATSQEEYWKKINEKMGLSRNTILKRIDHLVKLGVLRVTKGGKNRVNKILSIE